MIEIAETIMKLYAPEAAPQTKSIDPRCREALFGYRISNQNIEEKYLADYLVLIDPHYLASKIPPEHDDKLAKELYKKLPRNAAIAKLFIEKTTTEVGAGLDCCCLLDE